MSVVVNLAHYYHDDNHHMCDDYNFHQQQSSVFLNEPSNIMWLPKKFSQVEEALISHVPMWQVQPTEKLSK